MYAQLHHTVPFTYFKSSHTACYVISMYVQLHHAFLAAGCTGPGCSSWAMNSFVDLKGHLTDTLKDTAPGQRVLGAQDAGCRIMPTVTQLSQICGLPNLSPAGLQGAVHGFLCKTAPSESKPVMGASRLSIQQSSLCLQDCLAEISSWLPCLNAGGHQYRAQAGHRAGWGSSTAAMRACSSQL